MQPGGAWWRGETGSEHALFVGRAAEGWIRWRATRSRSGEPRSLDAEAGGGGRIHAVLVEHAPAGEAQCSLRPRCGWSE